MVGGKRFVILGQSKINSWSQLTAVRMHNMREMKVTNVPEDAPPPVVVVGQRDLVAGVKAKLAELDIKPRSGAVIAVETVCTTSSEWLEGDEEARRRKVEDVELRFRAYMVTRFGECVVSILRHDDETTVHWHGVGVPARKRVDGRFSDGASRWALSARELIGNRQAMQDEQTRFADWFADIGLVRGKVNSGTRRVPNVEHQAMLNAQLAAIGVEREGMQRERDGFAARAVALAEEEAAAARARAEAETDRVEAARALDEAQARREMITHEADAIRAAREDLDEREAEFQKRRAAANARLEKLRQDVATVNAKRVEYDAGLASLTAIEADAAALRRVLAMIDVPDARLLGSRALMDRLAASTASAARENPAFARSLGRARSLAA